MRDQEFLGLREARGGGGRRTLLLAKVPQNMQTDQTMRHLMSDFAREVSGGTAQFRKYRDHDPSAHYEYAEGGRVYDEYQEGYEGSVVEYRYADSPLALGELNTMNHALFAGLLHTGSTPTTDDPFQHRALAIKLRRAGQAPVIQQTVADRMRARLLKADQLAATALTNVQLDLPTLNPEVLSLSEVLEYRQNHDSELHQARDKLDRLARGIEAEPWSVDFAKEPEHRTIPDITDELDEARKACDARLKSKGGRTPVASATTDQGLTSGAIITGAKWRLDWRNGKKNIQENRLY